MTYTSTFGTLLSRSVVEQAAIATLQTPPPGSNYPLLTYYLAEVERQAGIPPRTLTPPSVIRGGIDFSTWRGDEVPLLIVRARRDGDAERVEHGVYQQWWNVQIAAIVENADGDQDAVRLLADWYGAAVMGCVAQNGGLGTRIDDDGSTVPFAERTVLTSTPDTTFLEDRGSENRRFAQATNTFHVLVEHAVAEGAPALGPDPYVAPGSWPTITTVDVDLVSQELDGTAGPQSGVTVADPSGQVLVNE